MTSKLAMACGALPSDNLSIEAMLVHGRMRLLQQPGGRVDLGLRFGAWGWNSISMLTSPSA